MRTLWRRKGQVGQWVQDVVGRLTCSALLALGLLLSGAAVSAAPPAQNALQPVPVLAYYYIWFDRGSWDRAKTDYPLLGRYSSDDPEVMRQHVAWAQQAGIDGFIVSWKSTEKLNRRLAQLADIAADQGFYLLVIYQGLDFERQPLSIQRIAADLDWFAERYADHQAFALFDRPVVIWSGTWEYTQSEVAAVTEGRASSVWILASERNADGYSRLADLVHGNAYYWSSVNPQTYAGYAEKLADMGQRVHDHGGLWIAPAAAGFDARLIGGTRVVEREDGENLRRQLHAAMRSSPDAIGMISWNEFSENTHVEPSEEYGTRYLEVLADIDHPVVPVPLQFASDLGLDTGVGSSGGRLLALGLLGAVVLASLVVIALRPSTDERGGPDAAPR